MALYQVFATLKNQGVVIGYNEAMFEIEAQNKALAISGARKEVRRAMLFDRHDGPVLYRAVQIDKPVEAAVLPVAVSTEVADSAPLDPRIGILIKEGKKVYYAFVAGKYISDTNLSIVMAAL